MSFDRKQLIDNIYRFAKEKDIKIGALEQEAGVSAGYLSRLLKDDTKGSFGVDLLCSAAEQLGKTLDALVYSSTGELSDNEKKIIDFFDKLTLSTENYSLEWSMMPAMIQDPTYLFTHQLFREVDCTAEDPDGNFHYYEEMEYCSHFLDRGDIKIDGNCFHVLFDKFAMTEIYIMNVSFYDNKTFDRKNGILEVYFLTRDKVEPIACTEYVCDQVDAAIHRLYDSIEAARSHLSLKSNSISAIDRFLKG